MKRLNLIIVCILAGLNYLNAQTNMSFLELSKIIGKNDYTLIKDYLVDSLGFSNPDEKKSEDADLLDELGISNSDTEISGDTVVSSFHKTIEQYDAIMQVTSLKKGTVVKIVYKEPTWSLLDNFLKLRTDYIIKNVETVKNSQGQVYVFAFDWQPYVVFSFQAFPDNYSITIMENTALSSN